MSSDSAASPAKFPPGFLNQYIGHAPFAAGIAFIVLEVLAVLLRFWARRIGKVAWGADDTLIIPGAIFCVAVCGCGIADVVAGGVGYHEAALLVSDPGKVTMWAKFALIIPMMYLPAVLFPKLAILAIYLRIFTKASHRITCWVLISVLIANYVGTTVAGFFICIPLEYLWNPTIPGGRCFNINAWFRWSSLANIVTDAVMLILPLPMIQKLHTSKKIKMGLYITFATGSIGLVTSIIRFSNFFTQNATVDTTYSAANLVIWTDIEPGMYLIAACLPTYRPFASLLRKGPLSLVRLGAKNTESRRSQARKRSRTFAIPLKTSPRSEDDASRLAYPYGMEKNTVHAERAESMTSESRDSGGRTMRHDVGVLSV